MKKLLITFLLSIICGISFAQERYHYTGYQVCVGLFENQQLIWGPWDACDVNVTIIDYYTYNVIIVNSNKPQRYITYDKGIGNVKSSYGKLFKAIDEEGKECTIKLINFNNEYHIYFFWNDIAWGYKI